MDSWYDIELNSCCSEHDGLTTMFALSNVDEAVRLRQVESPLQERVRIVCWADMARTFEFVLYFVRYHMVTQSQNQKKKLCRMTFWSFIDLSVETQINRAFARMETIGTARWIIFLQIPAMGDLSQMNNYCRLWINKPSKFVPKKQLQQKFVHRKLRPSNLTRVELFRWKKKENNFCWRKPFCWWRTFVGEEQFCGNKSFCG